MYRFILLFLIIFSNQAIKAQPDKAKVLTLGIFHFNFPNLDVLKIDSLDQIDVFNEKYQNEIEFIVNSLATFEPTIIVIEIRTQLQSRYDSLYSSYLTDNYTLGRNEEEQIGFRLAKKTGLKKLYCVDEWGDFISIADSMVFGKDTLSSKRFETYYLDNPDSGKYYHPKPVFKTKGIIEELRRINDPAYLQKSLGNYLIGPFKFENNPKDFLGVHFETGRWFNRNLKIFRNIQRIETKGSDRILVIFGADHMNLLNVFFKSSPEYELVNTIDYLK